MGDDTTQKKAYDFLVEHLSSQESFTKEKLRTIAGWSKSTIDTYFSKQFRGFLRKESDGKFKVTQGFRKYIEWKNFRRLVTQVRGGEKGYAVRAYPGVMIFEFFMPLANEVPLRTVLDALFYKDRIMQRLRSVDISALKERIPAESLEGEKVIMRRSANGLLDALGAIQSAT